jgi:benzoyl-CoA 2,3-dioxygenase component A
MTEAVIKQHLIDPEICIRCNTCEAICPVSAITHDSRNYVVDAEQVQLVHGLHLAVPHRLHRQLAHHAARQGLQPWKNSSAGTNCRPSCRVAELAALAGEAGDDAAAAAPAAEALAPVADPTGQTAFNSAQYGATLPPWSAAHAYTNLYGPKAAEKTVTATVAGNVRVTEVGKEYDTHHIVLDFGSMPFPVLEGQSIGIIPPGMDAKGAAPCAPVFDCQPAQRRAPGLQQPVADRQARAGRPPGPAGARRGQQLHVRPEGGRQGAGDRPVRRQLPDAQPPAQPHRDDLHRHRQRAHARHDRVAPPAAPVGKFEGGKLMLFFGARTQEELPYFGPLQNLPKDFIDINFAFSRTPGQPKRYVQDLMRERAADLAAAAADPNTCFYVCGLKAMEEGVVLALRDIAQNAGLTGTASGAALKREGRLHLETY